MNSVRKYSLAAGVFYLLTFVSIPTLALYGSVRGPSFVRDPGPDTGRQLPNVSLRLAAAAALLACAGPSAEKRSTSETPSAATDTAARTHAVTSSAQARLDSAARRVLAFLRGQLPPESIPLADTVVLRLAPEGGGYEARVARAALRSPSAWAVPAGRTRYLFVPPPTYTNVTSAVGRHFNCREYELATRAPDWAPAPHVGVSLRPDIAASCLHTWNATFVFDTSATGDGPRLAGVLYDQWEW